jgi:hypothetical protein
MAKQTNIARQKKVKKTTKITDRTSAATHLGKLNYFYKERRKLILF